MSPKHQRYQMLESLDLSGVLARLQAKEGFDIRRAEKTVTMYKRFLKMVMENPAEIMVPNEDVDAAWHHHILDTQTYGRDCQNLFGQFLHHNPNFYGTDAFFAACDNTQATYEKSFGAGETFMQQSSTTGNLNPSLCGPEPRAAEPTLNLQSSLCGGMLKGDTDLSLAPSLCGGMLKGDTELALAPSICGGMLKDEETLNLAPSLCGGMLKGDTELNLKPSLCGGMLKDDGEELNVKPQVAADALFKPYNEDSAVH